MAVITISKQPGAGGEALGNMIADKLGYTYADRDVIQMIAKAANVSPEWVETFENEAGTKLSRFIEMMVSQRWMDRVLADERGYLDEKIYLDYLVLMIAKLADEGDVVIAGRGSQYILDDHPDAFHILLINSEENRIQFVMSHYNLSRKKALQYIQNEEKRRTNLYKRIGKTDYENPSLYDLVLNMSKYDLESALQAICDLIPH
ncbi:MAG: cytidylate kinase-like family protein [Desulfobacterales bacterium]|nr:cytidylate kinase-like family protein [Desulfobacterales bacterium]